jgi:hypothetical protein
VNAAELVEFMVDFVKDEGFVVISGVVLHYFHNYRKGKKRTRRN